ncbi:MAG TPA: aldo/keto reductase [Chromatiales bacterium]|nr:aldo/keto reductase [Thiotrichales bacterium]HIP67398.1 aldo/keto reductase [Chromatiales bacterium]
MNGYSRREFLQCLIGLGIIPFIPAHAEEPRTRILKRIPSSGELLPVIGMGSSRTFNVGNNMVERAIRVEILRTFFAHGGAMIDSSPMYGSSEEVIGYCLSQLRNKNNLFAATKVWTLGKNRGIRQMQRSEKLWGVGRFDLMQIHNMLDWRKHLSTLKNWKDQGNIRYIGITTSHGRRHEKLIKVIKSEPFDFFQFSYNILDRKAEQYLLPLAKEHGIAVIINRPFQRGSLFKYVKGKPLPDWAGEFDCENWAQFFLKFIISHPAVTCVIPATSKVAHMQENMGAGFGELPDAEMRLRMIRHFEKL